MKKVGIYRSSDVESKEELEYLGRYSKNEYFVFEYLLLSQDTSML